MASIFLTGCTKKNEINIFAATSLHRAMTELAKEYEENHSDIKIILNADSSSKLMNQIEEGFNCDIFFSASLEQMDRLEEEGLLINGSRCDVLNNRLVLICRKNKNTKVRGLANISEAKSLALAGPSVPAGRYTRLALYNMGLIDTREKALDMTTLEISEALGGIEISEADNVSKVVNAVSEDSCEVGMVYYSDILNRETDIKVLEIIPKEITGEIIYPISRVINEQSSIIEQKFADDFFEYIISDEAMKVFEEYGFDANVR